MELTAPSLLKISNKSPSLTSLRKSFKFCRYYLPRSPTYKETDENDAELLVVGVATVVVTGAVVTGAVVVVVVGATVVVG
jgi:hypothetical protein